MLSLPSFGPMGPRPSRNFDPHTGQVFVEVVVPAGRAAKSPATRLVNLRRSRTRSRGPASLARLAMNEMVRQSFDLTPDHVAALPEHKRREFWARAKELPDTQLAAWKLLADQEHADVGCSYLHQSSVEHDSAHANDLPAWIPKLACEAHWTGSLNRQSFAWLTALTINNVDCSRQELIDLYKLKNLVALDICGKPREWDLPEGAVSAYGKSNGFLDERLLWHWANHAYHDDAFRQFRVLIARNEPAISKTAAPFLAGLPTLQLLGLQDCGVHPLTDRDEFLQNQFVVRDCIAVTSYRDLNHDIALEQGWDGVLRVCVNRTIKDCQREAAELTGFPDSGYATESSQDDAQPNILNFRMGQTPSGTIFSKNIVFFHHEPQKIESLKKEAKVGSDWVFVPKGSLLPDGSERARKGGMAPPLTPALPGARVHRNIRSRAKLDLHEVFAETGISSAPSASVHGDMDMQRSTSIGEPASAFRPPRRLGPDSQEKDDSILGGKGDRKRGLGVDEVADGVASAPGTPPRRPCTQHNGRIAKTSKKSLPLGIPARTASTMLSASIDFTDNLNGADLQTLFHEPPLDH